MRFFYVVVAWFSYVLLMLNLSIAAGGPVKGRGSVRWPGDGSTPISTRNGPGDAFVQGCRMPLNSSWSFHQFVPLAQQHPIGRVATTTRAEHLKQ